MMIVIWLKEEEARGSQECNVFDKVNGLRVALCFGGCRVLGCINSCGFHGVRISGSRLTSAFISPLQETSLHSPPSAQQHDTSSSY
eukprot:scaffold9398_cov135-Skeletonema_dohrnii-CCMP3373.AAC.2